MITYAHYKLCPPDLDINETTEGSKCTSYPDLLLSVTDVSLSTKFNFRNFPYICSNIPVSSLLCYIIYRNV